MIGLFDSVHSNQTDLSGLLTRFIDLIILDSFESNSQHLSNKLWFTVVNQSDPDAGHPDSTCILIQYFCTFQLSALE